MYLYQDSSWKHYKCVLEPWFLNTALEEENVPTVFEKIVPRKIFGHMVK
jgi:hypothetical protein